MKTQHFELELLTRCFLGGGKPREVAELRASSIRGQLRWWFRTLGGFNAPASSNLRQQEDEIFGVAAGDSGTAGMLRVQILRTAPVRQEIIGLAHVPVPVEEKYFLWPFEQDPTKPRACLAAGTKFQLRVHWRGNPARWPSIQALVTVFGQLGSLGTRSRRAMGALGFANGAPNLATALSHFSRPTSITVRQVNPAGHTTVEATVAALAAWLKGWRQHGRTSEHQPAPNDPKSPGFDFALRDHDEGIVAMGRSRPTACASGHTPRGIPFQSYRPALGLPILQRFGSGGSVNWNFGAGANRGRFASPIILRPYRIAANKWRALVIFVDAHKWPDDPATVTPTPKSVYLDGAARAVSRDLYDEMKRLTPTPFP